MPRLKPQFRKRLLQDSALRLRVALAAGGVDPKTITRWAENDSIQLSDDKIVACLARELNTHPDDLVIVDPELKRLMDKQQAR